MEAENKIHSTSSVSAICQNCQTKFAIEPEDFSYYKKIDVPAPTWCPECRTVRRMACGNSWSFFWRNCNKCEKKMLSMYSPEKDLTVYCQPCWWGDSWDGTEYAMDYDPKRSFLEQLKELSEKTPYATLETSYSTLKNCDYTNAIGHSKNCFMIVWADYCESVYYSSILNGLKFSSDCIRGWESELCYGSIGFINNYRVFFSDECNSCVDVYFSRNCYSCTNCIGCVNLRGASYSIFNVKYSKEEYAKKIKELGLDSWKNLEKLEKQAYEFWLTKPYREYHGDSLNLNVTGEYVFNSKNSKEGYIVNYAENCKWCQFITVASSKDCWDYSGWGHNVELLYECANVGEGASSCKFSAFCFPDSLNTEYCLWCPASKNNFGCVNLKRKSYCILNKQYSKESFDKLRTQIIADIKNNPYIDTLGRVYSYGEFFGLGFGKFAYNNSNAGKFFPKNKKQALAEGYSWNDEENPTHDTSILSSDLPDTISETQESILDEVVECSLCKRGYKIVKGELDLLTKMNLPLPHQCPKCREDQRFARMTKPGLYNRECNKCGVAIYTPYSKERPEIVYCVKCYQQEFI